ncbi:MAG: insulinase family protein [Bacteroides sp.]|nr:insulinase family protein [Bacteroides sp.]
MNRKLFISLILGAGAAQAFGLNPIPTDTAIRHGRLPDGLTYYIKPNSSEKGHADFFLVDRAGSALETDSQKGLAHFLEHMAFNGTRHYPGHALIEYLEGLGVKFGADLNAYTSTEETMYTISRVPVSRQTTVDSCLLILRDWSGDITLSPEEIDAERGVVLGEMRQKRGAASYRMLEKAFPDIWRQSGATRWLPIGTQEVIEGFPYSDLEDFYRTWYQPANQAVVVVGDIDPARVEKVIRSLWEEQTGAFPQRRTSAFGALQRPEAPVVTVQTDPEQGAGMLQVQLRLPVLPEADRQTVNALKAYLKSELISRMLVARFDEAESVPDSPLSHTGIGVKGFLMSRNEDALLIRTDCKPENLTAATEVISKELKRALRDGFSDDELDNARQELKTELDKKFVGRHARSNTDIAKEIAGQWLAGGPVPSEEVRFQLLDVLLKNISRQDIAEYMAELLPASGQGSVIIAYAPETEGEAVADAPALTRAFLTADPAGMEAFVLPELPELEVAALPAPGTIVAETVDPVLGNTVWTLSNGVKVNWKKMATDDDLIRVKGYSPGGFAARFNPEGGVLYEIANDALALSRTGALSASDLKRVLAKKGVKGSLAVEKTEETVEAVAPASELETAMKLIYLKSTSLNPDTVAFRMLKERKEINLHNQKENATFAMGDSIHNYVYRKHPFGYKLRAGDMAKVSIDDVTGLYSDRFGDMGDFTFYVTGDIDEAGLRDLACRYLATLPSAGRMETERNTGYGFIQGTASHTFAYPMKNPQAITYYFVNSPAPYNLRNVIFGNALGQVLKSKLHEDLREEKGWTYNIKTHIGLSGGVDGEADANLIMPVYIKVDPAHAAETQEIVAQTVERLAEPGFITDEEVAKVRLYLDKQHSRAIEDPVYWISLLHMRDRYGKDMESGYSSVLESMTPASLAEFAASFLHDANRLQLKMMPQD